MNQYRAEQYRYIIGWSEDDQDYLGKVAEFPSLSAFADSLGDALKEITVVVEMVLEDLQLSGESIPQPIGVFEYQSNLTVHVSQATTEQLTLTVATEDNLLKSWATNRLSLGQRLATSNSTKILIAQNNSASKFTTAFSTRL